MSAPQGELEAPPTSTLPSLAYSYVGKQEKVFHAHHGMRSPYPSCLPHWLQYYGLRQTRTESLSQSQGFFKESGPEMSPCREKTEGQS